MPGEDGEKVESGPSTVWKGGSFEGDRGCERAKSRVAESGEVSEPKDSNAAGDDVPRYPRRNCAPSGGLCRIVLRIFKHLHIALYVVCQAL